MGEGREVGHGAVLVLAGLAVIVLGVWGLLCPGHHSHQLRSLHLVGIVIFVMLTITPVDPAGCSKVPRRPQKWCGENAASSCRLFAGLERGHGHSC